MQDLLCSVDKVSKGQIEHEHSEHVMGKSSGFFPIVIGSEGPGDI